MLYQCVQQEGHDCDITLRQPMTATLKALILGRCVLIFCSAAVYHDADRQLSMSGTRLSLNVQ